MATHDKDQKPSTSEIKLFPSLEHEVKVGRSEGNNLSASKAGCPEDEQDQVLTYSVLQREVARLHKVVQKWIKKMVFACQDLLYNDPLVRLSEKKTAKMKRLMSVLERLGRKEERLHARLHRLA